MPITDILVLGKKYTIKKIDYHVKNTTTVHNIGIILCQHVSALL